MMNQLHEEGEVRLIYLPIPVLNSNMSDAELSPVSERQVMYLEAPERLVNY